jgi:hypothetical protein
MTPTGFESPDFLSNPYQATSTPADREPKLDREFSEMIASMARWQTFIATLGFLFTGLTVLVLLTQSVGTGGFISMLMVLIAIFFYLAPSVVLYRAAASARSFANLNGSSLNDVIATQRAFWRFVGVAICIFIFLNAMILIAVFAMAFMVRTQ